jgi:hypothetical protein
MMPLALFFFSQNYFGYLQPLWFYTNFSYFSFFCEKWHWNFGKDYIEFEDDI